MGGGLEIINIKSKTVDVFRILAVSPILHSLGVQDLSVRSLGVG